MRGSNINIPQPILLNKMVLQRGRIGLLLRWQGQCMMSTSLHTSFGPKPSTPRAMPLIGYISASSRTRHLMNSIGKKPNVKYFRVFSCKCFILNKKTRLAKFEAKTYEGIFVGYASNSHAYR